MTTAANVGCGKAARTELKKTSSSTTATAPTTPVSCVFALAFSATAVRDALLEIVKPWNRPAEMLAAPTPIISLSALTDSLRRAAKLAEVAIVSVIDTRVMPTAAISSGPTSPTFVHGTVGVGKPRGSAPTVDTPRADRSNTAETTVAPTITTRMAGRRVVEPRQHDQQHEAAEPDREGCPDPLVQMRHEGLDLVDEAAGIGREAEQLRAAGRRR